MAATKATAVDETEFLTGIYACKKHAGKSTRAQEVRTADAGAAEELLRSRGRGYVFRCEDLLRMTREGEILHVGPGWVFFERNVSQPWFHCDSFFGQLTDEVVTLPKMNISKVKHIFLKDDFSIDSAHLYALPMGGSVLVARSTFRLDDKTMADDLGASYVVVKSYTKWNYVKNEEYLAVLRPGFSGQRNFDFLKFFRGEINLPKLPF